MCSIQGCFFFRSSFDGLLDWNSSLSTINFIPYKYCVIVVANDSITDCDLCNVGTMTCSNCSRLSVLCILAVLFSLMLN